MIRNGILGRGKRAVTEAEIHRLFAKIDADASGRITAKEFEAFVGKYQKVDSKAMKASLRKAKADARQDQLAAIDALRVAIRVQSYQEGGVDVARFFGYLDKDKSGSIERSEFLRAMRRAGLSKTSGMSATGSRVTSDQPLLIFFDAIDKDGSGEIGLEEFVKFVENKKSIAGRSSLDEMKTLLKKEFEAADLDGNGRLDQDEFRTCLEGPRAPFIQLHSKPDPNPKPNPKASSPWASPAL